MNLRSCFLLLVFLLCASICWGQNKNEDIVKLDLISFYTHNPKYQLQQFKITLDDSWFGKDKADHFLVSAFLTATSFYFIRQEQTISEKISLYFSIGFAFSLGLAKEIRDGFRQGNAASIKDLIADILGTGMGTLLFNSDN